MVISFDWDGTVTLATDLFLGVMRSLQEAGWTVLVITRRGSHRRPTVESVLAGAGMDVPVIHDSGPGKRTAAAQAGYKVDIWVDDEPYTVDWGAWLKRGVTSPQEIRGPQ